MGAGGGGAIRGALPEATVDHVTDPGPGGVRLAVRRRISKRARRGSFARVEVTQLDLWVLSTAVPAQEFRPVGVAIGTRPGRGRARWLRLDRGARHGLVPLDEGLARRILMSAASNAVASKELAGSKTRQVPGGAPDANTLTSTGELGVRIEEAIEGGLATRFGMNRGRSRTVPGDAGKPINARSIRDSELVGQGKRQWELQDRLHRTQGRRPRGGRR